MKAGWYISIIVFCFIIKDINGANRYWIGGAANSWTNTANWSVASGGTGGATVPSITDNVIFDSNSGAIIIVIDSIPATTVFSLSIRDSIKLSLLNLSTDTLFITDSLNVIRGTLTLDSTKLIVYGTTTIYGSLRVDRPQGYRDFGDVIIKSDGLLSIDVSGNGDPKVHVMDFTVEAGGNCVFDNDGTLRIYGNFHNAGNFQPGNSRITFYGDLDSTDQKITGNSIQNFFEVVINSAGDTVDASSIDVINILQNFQEGGSFKAPRILNISGNILHNGQVFIAGDTINIYGDWERANNQANEFRPGSGTVIFKGNNTSFIKGKTSFYNFNNLVIDDGDDLEISSTDSIFIDSLFINTGSFKAPEDLIISGSVLINGGIFYAQGNRIYVAGNWTDNAGSYDHGYGTIIFNGNSLLNGSAPQRFNNIVIDGILTDHQFNFRLLGNWTNNGSFVADTGNVTFEGNVLQTISGDSITSFRNLTITNSTNPFAIALDRNIIVEKTLFFNDGIILTGNDTLLLSDSANVNGADANKYIAGYELINIPASSGSVIDTFHIGDSSGYAPVIIEIPVTTSPGYIVAFTDSGSSDYENTSGLKLDSNLNRYYNLYNNQVAFDSCKLTFNFNAGEIDAGANYQKFIARRFQFADSTWKTTETVLKNPLSLKCRIDTSLLGEFIIGEKDTLTVNTQPPDSITICANVDAFITASSISKPTPEVVWHRIDSNGIDSVVSDSLDYPDVMYGNVNTSTLSVIDPAEAIDSFQYYAVFSNINGIAYSETTTLIVNQALIKTQPVGDTVCGSDTVSLFVIPFSSGFSYQWFFNGNAIPGATNDSLTPSVNGNYYVVVSGIGQLCSPETSATAYVVMNAAVTKPYITESPDNGVLQSINLWGGSENITFRVKNPDSALTYSWRLADTTNYKKVFIKKTNEFITNIDFYNGAYSDTLYVIAEETGTAKCPDSSAVFINIKGDSTAKDTITETFIMPFATDSMLVYLNNSMNGYKWGYDSADNKYSDFIQGQVYQLLVPPSHYTANHQFLQKCFNVLDTCTFDFWVMVYRLKNQGHDTSRTKIYFDGEYRCDSCKFYITQDNPIQITSSVVPNPNNGNFQLELSGNIYGKLLYQVANMLGEVVDEKKLFKRDAVQQFTFNEKSLSPGMYHIHIQGEQGENAFIKWVINGE